MEQSRKTTGRDVRGQRMQLLVYLGAQNGGDVVQYSVAALKYQIPRLNISLTWINLDGTSTMRKSGEDIPAYCISHAAYYACRRTDF